ncbi:hypothetical protein Pmar_PMAR028960, partial [Perkinsus marinus ATCC 50983]
MAFVRSRKGYWDGIYEPSEEVLSALGRVTAVQKKGHHHHGSIMDISTEELVDITDESVLSVKEGEGQTKKRLLRRMPNPPYDDVIMSVAVEGYSITTGEDPAPEVGEEPISTLAGLSAQSPFITLKSKLADEKQMILMSEGKDELEKKTNLLVQDLSLKVEAEAPVPQGGKDKKAAATEGEVKEGKSDVEMEVLFPRFTVFLTGSTKGREREDSEGENYIQEVVVGAKLSGKLIRGKPYVSEEEKERLAEEKIAMEKEMKKAKKGKKKGGAVVVEEPPMIKEYSWEVSNLGGVAIDEVMEEAPMGEEGTPPAITMTDLWGYIEEWVESTGSDPESWEIIMVRTKPVEKQQQVTEVIAIEMGWLMVLDMAERDEEDVMEALAVLCDGVAVRRLRPISSGVRFNRTYINFRMSPDTTGVGSLSSEDLLTQMEGELGGDPSQEGRVIEFLRKLKLTDEIDEDDTDTRPSDVEDDGEGSASKSTFKFSIQRTFEKSVDDGEKVNEYAKGRPVGAMAREDRRGEAEEYTVLAYLGNLGVSGGGLMTCRFGHGVSVRSMDELKRDVKELRGLGEDDNPLCA